MIYVKRLKDAEGFRTLRFREIGPDKEVCITIEYSHLNLLEPIAPPVITEGRINPKQSEKDLRRLENQLISEWGYDRSTREEFVQYQNL